LAWIGSSPTRGHGRYDSKEKPTHFSRHGFGSHRCHVEQTETRPRRSSLPALTDGLSAVSAIGGNEPSARAIAHQLLKAAIGALIEEGQVENSRRDMASKYALSLREARESNYWSRLGATDPKWTQELAPITKETGEFIAILTVSVRKLRSPVPTVATATGALLALAALLYFF